MGVGVGGDFAVYIMHVNKIASVATNQWHKIVGLKNTSLQSVNIGNNVLESFLKAGNKQKRKSAALLKFEQE